MKTKEPTRPLCLEFEDAKNEAFNAINNILKKHNLPMFLMEVILDDALRQVRGGVRNELTEAERFYQQQLEEAKKDEPEGGNDDGP